MSVRLAVRVRVACVCMARRMRASKCPLRPATADSFVVDNTRGPAGLATAAACAATARIVARLMREGEEELAKFTHPDPYVVPYMPGGSKFMRNPPPPLKAVFPEGIPSEHDVAYQDVHSVQVPQSAYPEGMETVFIDIYKKKSE